jgi:hypothetical protein
MVQARSTARQERGLKHRTDQETRTIPVLPSGSSIPHGTPEKTTSGTEAGLAALAVEGAALDLFEPGTPDPDPLDPLIIRRRSGPVEARTAQIPERDWADLNCRGPSHRSAVGLLTDLSSFPATAPAVLPQTARNDPFCNSEYLTDCCE